MRTKTKFLVPLLITVVLIGAIAGGVWVWYDNNVDRSGWFERDGIRYYRDFHADPVSGWLELEDDTYYFNNEGVPFTRWQEIDGTTYYFEDSGAMVTGWLTEQGKTHYFGGNGALVEGWLWLDTDRYYMEDGVMVTGWKTVDGERRFFDENGVMALGFAQVGGSTYYFGTDGAMAMGITEIDGSRYNFQADGTMFTGWEETEEGSRYYGENGAMAVGWAEVDGERCYFNEDGIRQHAGWLTDGEYRYYIHEDGSYAVGPTVIDGKKHYFTPLGIEVILVNAINPLPDPFEQTIVNVVDYHDVDSRCYDALVSMLADFEEQVGEKYTFNSAYRTTFEQTAILEYRTLEHMRDFDMTFLEARAKALETVAIPGTSEHQLGFSVDLVGKTINEWLAEHCWDYGFILRYPENKQHVTGITNEPWHFRYVGTRVSLDMKDSGLCLEEYLGADPVTQAAIEALHGDKWYREEYTTVDEETIAKYIGTDEEATETAAG